MNLLESETDLATPKEGLEEMETLLENDATSETSTYNKLEEEEVGEEQVATTLRC